MTISGPGWPPAHICPPRHPPGSPESGRPRCPESTISIQALLNNDHLGAWLASGPYLLSPAFPPAPQNLGIDTLSRKYHFSIQTLLNNDYLGAWLASRPYLPSPASHPAPQNLEVDTLSRKYQFSIQAQLNIDHLGAWLASGQYLPSPAFPWLPISAGRCTHS